MKTKTAMILSLAPVAMAVAFALASPAEAKIHVKTCGVNRTAACCNSFAPANGNWMSEEAAECNASGGHNAVTHTSTTSSGGGTPPGGGGGGGGFTIHVIHLSGGGGGGNPPNIH